MTDTLSIIQPIVTKTYGQGAMIDALAKHLAAKIEAGKFDSRGREYEIMLICWDWMPGGGTAASCARRIEAALEQPE